MNKIDVMLILIVGVIFDIYIFGLQLHIITTLVSDMVKCIFVAVFFYVKSFLGQGLIFLKWVTWVPLTRGLESGTRSRDAWRSVV